VVWIRALDAGGGGDRHLVTCGLIFQWSQCDMFDLVGSPASGGNTIVP